MGVTHISNDPMTFTMYNIYFVDIYVLNNMQYKLLKNINIVSDILNLK